MTSDPIDIYKSLVKAGDEMADSHYEYRLLDDATKSILAQITMECKKSVASSMAEASQIALSSSTYRDHLAATAEAHRITERAKIRYYAQRALSDHYRTAEATARAAAGRAT